MDVKTSAVAWYAKASGELAEEHSYESTVKMNVVTRFLAKQDSYKYDVTARGVAPIHGIGTPLSYYRKYLLLHLHIHSLRNTR